MAHPALIGAAIITPPENLRQNIVRVSDNEQTKMANHSCRYRALEGKKE
jgi:hypothetical protein